MAEKSQRGFAGMDPALQREIASRGGRAAHASGHAHEFDSEEAAEAGRKGGLASHHKNAGFRREAAADLHRDKQRKDEVKSDFVERGTSRDDKEQRSTVSESGGLRSSERQGDGNEVEVEVEGEDIKEMNEQSGNKRGRRISKGEDHQALHS